MSLCGRLTIVFEGLKVIPRDTLSLIIQIAESELGIRVALVCRISKAFERFGVVARSPRYSTGVTKAEVKQRPGMTLFGGSTIPCDGGFRILGDRIAQVIFQPQLKLILRHAGARARLNLWEGTVGFGWSRRRRLWTRSQVGVQG